MEYAILIDGGVAKTKLSSRENPACFKDFTKLVEVIKPCAPSRRYAGKWSTFPYMGWFWCTEHRDRGV